MLEIYLLTGTVWLKKIVVEGTVRDDLISLIDEYYYEHGDLPVKLYTLDEIREIYEDEEEFESELESMLPINGGEYYIDGISHVKEI